MHSVMLTFTIVGGTVVFGWCSCWNTYHSAAVQRFLYTVNLTLEALPLLRALCIPENHYLCRYLVNIMCASDQCEAMGHSFTELSFSLTWKNAINPVINTINLLQIILFITFSEKGILSDIYYILTQNDLFMAYVGLIFCQSTYEVAIFFKIVILVISATYRIRLFLQLLPAYKRGKDATFNLCVVL